MEFYIPKKSRKNATQSLLNHFPKKHVKHIEQGSYDFTEQYCKSNPHNLIMAQPIYNDIIKNIVFNCEQNHKTIRKLKKKIYLRVLIIHIIWRSSDRMNSMKIIG